MVSDAEALASRLRQARLLKDMSIEGVADALDTSTTSIWRYEAGQRRPSGPTLHALAALYGRSVNWLQGGQEEAETQQETDDVTTDRELVMSEPMLALRTARADLTDEDMHDIAEFIRSCAVVIARGVGVNARTKAKEIRRQWDIDGRVNVEWLADTLGLEVFRRTFVGDGVEEITVDGCIGVDEDLDERKQRWAIAHAIGHHVMHGSSWNQVWLRTCTLLPDKLEAQAEHFAYHLLVDTDEAIGDGMTDVGQVAESYGAPVEMVYLQARLV